MAITNPFPVDSPEGEAWQLGLQAGFTHPDLTGAPPFQVNLLTAYQEGADAGRSLRQDGPAAGETWIDEDAILEGIQLDIDVLVHIVGDELAGAAGGLLAVLGKVLEIPGDVELKPLPESFSVPVAQDQAKFVAVCLRKDHSLVTVGANADGTWAGSSRDSFFDAFDDLNAHEHPEACIARCSLSENTCGVVWVAKSSQ